TEPGTPDDYGIAAYYDVDQGAFVANVNTLVSAATAVSKIGKSDKEKVSRTADKTGKAIGVKEEVRTEGAVWLDGEYFLSFIAADLADNFTPQFPEDFGENIYFTVDNTEPVIADLTAPLDEVILPNTLFAIPAADLHLDRLVVELNIGGVDYAFTSFTDTPVDEILLDGDMGVADV
ncbi:MAG: hypothetical protein GY869_04565, partial [Planctomycetes bacterium]|nr:hypothetical protein [Planctomycetota bacterium]